MQQNEEEQDVPVGLPYGQPAAKGGAGAPQVRVGAGTPGAAGAPQEQTNGGRRGASARGVVRRRERQAVQRPHRLTPRFSDEELEDVMLAAVLAGLTPTGYVAKVAAGVAAQRLRPVPPGLVEALEELLVARRQVQRFSVLVNQAVAKWHATDELPGELLTAVALVGRALPRLEDAAASVRQAQDKATRRPTVAERVVAQQRRDRPTASS